MKKNKKSKNKSKVYVIALIAIMFFFAIGYAIFSNLLQITGTATTGGTFDIGFTSATVDNGVTIGVTPTATISGDNKTLTIAATGLAEPGSKAKIDVVVTNNGSIDAILKTINITGNTDADIPVTVTPTFTPDSTLAAGATYSFSITVEWASTSTTGSKNISFTVDLTYEQDV